MRNLKLLADRGLGFLGLFLIGALSWLADHVGTAEGPEPQSRHRSNAPPAPDRIDRLPVTRSPERAHFPVQESWGRRRPPATTR
jgi:hypothetical protein